MRYEEHAIIPVAPIRSVKVNAFVGSRQLKLNVFRPDPYDELTIVSHPSVSTENIPVAPRNAVNVAKSWISSAVPPIDIGGYYFDTRACEPNNVAHLITRIIPLCMIMSKYVRKDITYIFRSLQPHFEELLQSFGVTPFCTRRRVTGVAVEGFLSRNLDQYNIHRAPDPITSLIDGIFEKKMESKGARIYISRRGARSLKNEQEVRSVVEAYGYSTIYMEDCSIAEQISVSQSASNVVAIHGAAMGYLALNGSLNSVIELMPNHVGTAFFPIAFGHQVLEYWQLISEFSEEIQFAGWEAIEAHKNTPFSVNIEHLRVALQQAHLIK